MRKPAKILFVFLFILTLHITLYTLHGVCAVPHLINYQGKLTDSSGTPLTGSYNITFRIYDAETAGNLLWQEAHAGVVIQKGIFSVLLGSATALDLPFDKQYFLAIQVGSDPEMSPRQRITSAGYAIKAEKAESALLSDNASKINNISVNSTPTANTLLPLDANGKFPNQVLQLKSYDSGWFPVNVDTTYTKIHNLNTTKVIISLMFSPNSDGSGFMTVFPDIKHYDAANTNKGGGVVSLSDTQIQIRYIHSFFRGRDANGTEVSYSSGYMRIIMLALE